MADTVTTLDELAQLMTSLVLILWVDVLIDLRHVWMGLRKLRICIQIFLMKDSRHSEQAY